MNQFMDWKECEKKYVRKVEIDKDKVISIVKTSEKRLNFIDAIKISEDNISFIIENYYEIIKELLVALLLTKGIKSSNHQCLITYLYLNYPEHEDKAHLISQMCYFRNRLNYYGEIIDISFYEKNKEEFTELIGLLKELIRKEGLDEQESS